MLHYLIFGVNASSVNKAEISTSLLKTNVIYSLAY